MSGDPAAGGDGVDPTDEGLVDVHLRAVPVPLWQRSAQHADELLREFALLRLDTPGQVHVPRRLLELVSQLSASYGSFSTGPEQQLQRAAADGETEVDLHYRLPPAAADAAAELGRLLDEADEFCRSGRHLLTLATPADQVAFRRWFLAEFARQVGGEPPLPWPQVAAAG